MRNIKRITAFTLAILLLFSLFPASALADESEDDKSFNIVNLGDSTTVGFGLDDYGVYARYPYLAYPIIKNVENMIVWHYSTLNLGFLDTISSDAPCARLAEYIKATMPNREVSFTNLGISGIRAAEIRAVLDPEYIGENYTQKYWEKTWAELRASHDLEDWGDDCHSFFVEEIADADLITLDCLMNSFTASLSERVYDAINGNTSNTRDYNGELIDLLSDASPAIKALSSSVPAALKTALQFVVLQPSRLQKLVDAIEYCVLDCCVNFNEAVGLIREINSDAKILVSSAFCPFKGLIVCYGDYKLDLYDLLSPGIDAVNLYLRSLCENRGEYIYYELPEDIETFRVYMGSAGSYSEISPVFLGKLVDDTLGLWKKNIDIFRSLYADVVEAGHELGTEVVEWKDFWSFNVADAFEDVYENKENAAPESLAWAKVFGEYAEVVLRSMSITELDLETYYKSKYSDSDYCVLAFAAMGRDYNELGLTEKTELFTAVARDLRNGLPIHFSYKGNEQKYEAMLNAYESQLSDEDSASESGFSLSRFFTPFLNFFRSLFDLSPLRNFFGSILKR